MTWNAEEHPLSASKLKTFQRCAEQFRLKYIERRDPAGQDPYYLEIGDAVHYTIETYLERKTGPWVGPESTESDLKVQLSQTLEEEEIELDDEQRSTVLTCLSKAAKFLSSHEPEIRGVEDEVDFRIQRDWIDVPATGYMDLTTEGPDWVIDWKTGKSEGKELDELLQGSTYMAGFYDLYGVVPDQIVFVYLKEGKVRKLDPDDEMWAEFMEYVESMLTAVDRDEFRATPGESKCHWCDYEPHCSASPVGAGNISWEKYP